MTQILSILLVVALFGLSKSEKCMVDQRTINCNQTSLDEFDYKLFELMDNGNYFETVELFNITDTQIKYFPKNPGSNQISSIRISHSQLEFIDPNAFVDIDNIDYLDLSFNKFTEFAHINSISLWTLNLTHNVIKKLEINYLPDRLRNLDLSFCEIESVNVNGNYKYLSLNLSHNNIIRFDSGLLNYLDLSYNPLQVLNFSADSINLLGCENLSKITIGASQSCVRIKASRFWSDLTSTKICDLILTNSNLTETIQIQNSYRFIDLSYNPITRIPSNFCVNNCDSASKLLLSNTLIANIHDQAFKQLTGLIELDLSNTLITKLNRSMLDKLNGLKYLNLSHTLINDIEIGSFDQLNGLYDLDLSNTRIMELKSNMFSGLKELRTLILSNTLINDIEIGSFDQLNGLYDLDLSNTRIMELKSNMFSGLNELRTLILSNTLINDIEIGTFVELYNLEFLDLSKTYITRIKRNTFQGLRNLNSLTLSDTLIKDIDEDDFEGLSNLRILNLSNCRIKEIKNNMFNHLSLLETLVLSNNSLFTIDANVFSDLYRLELLDLSNSQIGKIEPYAFKIPYNYGYSPIRVINLTHCRISALEDFSDYVHMKLHNSSIDIISNRIFSIMNLTNLPTSEIEYNLNKNLHSNISITFPNITLNSIFTKLNNLQILKIESSPIHQLTNNCFRGLYNLIDLNFHNSDIYNIESKALHGLFNLESLDSQVLFKHVKTVQDNLFEHLYHLKSLNLSNLNINLKSNSFVGLKRLEKLLLNNNEMLFLPANIFKNVNNLYYLDISHNRLSNLESFNILPNLNELYLNDNDIFEIKAKTFENLMNIQELYLYNNQLSTINLQSFIGLSALRFLHLQNNNIENITIGSFQYCTNLEELYLQFNEIKTLSVGSFSNLNLLKKLDLSDNAISTFNVMVIFSLNSLEIINLDNNHLISMDYEVLIQIIHDHTFSQKLYIGIQNNKWKCELLLKMIMTFKKQRLITFQPNNPNFDSENIDGISCIDICKYLYCENSLN